MLDHVSRIRRPPGVRDGLASNNIRPRSFMRSPVARFSLFDGVGDCRGVDWGSVVMSVGGDSAESWCRGWLRCPGPLRRRRRLSSRRLCARERDVAQYLGGERGHDAGVEKFASVHDLAILI